MKALSENETNTRPAPCPFCGLPVELTGAPQQDGNQDRVWHPHSDCIFGGKMLPLRGWQLRHGEQPMRNALQESLAVLKECGLALCPGRGGSMSPSRATELQEAAAYNVGRIIRKLTRLLDVQAKRPTRKRISIRHLAPYRSIRDRLLKNLCEFFTDKGVERLEQIANQADGWVQSYKALMASAGRFPNGFTRDWEPPEVIVFPLRAMMRASVMVGHLEKMSVRNPPQTSKKVEDEAAKLWI